MEDEAGKGQEGEDKGLEGKEDECLKGNGQQDGNDDIGFDMHADDDGYGESEYSIGREGENGTGKGHGGKEKAAAALAANLSWKIDNKLNVKVDKDGQPMVVGDTVMCYAAKQKDKYDRRKAKVERLNAHQAVITMLERPCSGREAQGGVQVARALVGFEKVIRRWCLLLRVCGKKLCGRPCAANGGEPLGA